MKKIVYLLTLLSNCAFAQIKNGEQVPDIQFKPVLNAPVKQAALRQLKGKVVLIEFWATWCGSCIAAMPHLQALQKKYAGRLQVIAVTDETVKRTSQFLAVRPFDYWFAVDSGSVISKLFPHQLIPHTVIIDTDGKLIANTSPELVTDNVMDSLLANKPVNLAEKKDVVMDYEDIIKKYFFAADTVKNRFMMLPEIKGAPGLSTTWLADSAFSGRRLTCLNLDLVSLYRLANNDFPYSRTIDKTKKGSAEVTYCVDLIVQHKADLRQTLLKGLLQRFDLQAKVETQTKDVYVLKITDAEKFKTISRNTSGKRTYYSRHGEIDQQEMTMKDFADFLENYGNGNLPVIDETGNTEMFDIKFSYQPENPASLTAVLTGMGLTLEKQRHPVDMLIVYTSKSI